MPATNQKSPKRKGGKTVPKRKPIVCFTDELEIRIINSYGPEHVSTMRVCLPDIKQSTEFWMKARRAEGDHTPAEVRAALEEVSKSVTDLVNQLRRLDSLNIIVILSLVSGFGVQESSVLCSQLTELKTKIETTVRQVRNKRGEIPRTEIYMLVGIVRDILCRNNLSTTLSEQSRFVRVVGYVLEAIGEPTGDPLYVAKKSDEFWNSHPLLMEIQANRTMKTPLPE